MSTENRYVRLEDWEGNRYFFSGGKGGSGGFGNEAVDASRIETDVLKANDARFYSAGTIVDDARASSGKGVVLDYTDTNTFYNRTLFKGLYDNVPLGNIAITLRLLPIFKDATWFFEENATAYDDIELFYVKIRYYDNKTKQVVRSTPNDIVPIGVITVSSLKTYPIVPCLGYGTGSGKTLKQIYQDNIAKFANAVNFGEVTVVLPYSTTNVSKNSSLLVEVVTEDRGDKSYNPTRNNRLLTSLILDNVSISKATGSVTSASYRLSST